MLNVTDAGRPAGDILSRVVRIKLGGQEFALPVRSIKANREWKQQLDLQTAGIVDALTKAGEDWQTILTRLESDVDPFIDLLVSYAPTILSRELIEEIEPDPSMDVIAACQEVWLAATPLLATGIEALKAISETSTGSAPTSSPPPNGAGAPRRRSKKH